MQNRIPVMSTTDPILTKSSLVNPTIEPFSMSDLLGLDPEKAPLEQDALINDPIEKSDASFDAASNFLSQWEPTPELPVETIPHPHEKPSSEALSESSDPTSTPEPFLMPLILIPQMTSQPEQPLNDALMPTAQKPSNTSPQIEPLKKETVAPAHPLEASTSNEPTQPERLLAPIHTPPVTESKTELPSIAPTTTILTHHLSDFLNHAFGQASAPIPNATATNPPLSNAPAIEFELTTLAPETTPQSSQRPLEQYVAHIKLSPPDLGKISAKIEINQGITTITLVTEHAHVKQLMEVNLHALRHAFEGSNLQLTSVNVQNSDARDAPHSQQPPREKEDDPSQEGRHEPPLVKNKTIQSMIDTYA